MVKNGRQDVKIRSAIDRLNIKMFVSDSRLSYVIRIQRTRKFPMIPKIKIKEFKIVVKSVTNILTSSLLHGAAMISKSVV